MASLARSLRPARRLAATLSRTITTTPRRLDGAREEAPSGELGVGELQGAKFKIEPLRRTGEDERTMRARLLCKLAPARRSSRRPEEHGSDLTDAT